MSFWKGKKVLVTGGTGFLGSFVLEQLVNAGAVVTVTSRRAHEAQPRIQHVLNQVQIQSADLSDYESCLNVCKKQEVVLNLAAKATGIGYNRLHHTHMFEINMRLQMNVLQAAAHLGVPRFLQVSSACVYPHDARVPTPESEGTRGFPEETNEGYGWAKRMGERLAQYYVGEKKIEAVIARPFNFYGPRDHVDLESGHVIPALMKKILAGEDPIVVWGSGNQSRSFVHVRDVARALILIAEKAPPGVPVNIGHDQEITIRDLFHLICKVTGRNPKAIFDTSKPDGYPRRSADPTLLKKITGYVPDTPIENGLVEVADMVMAGQTRSLGC